MHQLKIICQHFNVAKSTFSDITQNEFKELLPSYKTNLLNFIKKPDEISLTDKDTFKQTTQKIKNLLYQSDYLEKTISFFGQYANYLLYKEDGEINFDGEYEPDQAYELDYEMEGEFDATYWQIASRLLTAAIDEYKATNDAVGIMILFENYQQDFNFLYTLRQTGTPSEAEIINMPQNNRETYLDNFYQNFNSLTTDWVKEFINQSKLQYSTLGKVFDTYKQHGCITDNSLNEICADRVADDADSGVTSLLNEINVADQETTNTIEIVIRRVEANCWYISDQLNSLISEGNTDGKN